MDQQQLFLSNNIFDIDSALDRLEENLFTHSDLSAPTISNEKYEQQRVIDNGQQQQQKLNTDEENGNKVDDIASKSEELNVLDKITTCEDEITDFDTEQHTAVSSSAMDEISLQTKDEDESIVEKTETLNPAPTQTITLTSLSIDDKTSTTLASSDSSVSTSSSDSEGEEFIPAEITANQDESMNPLISEESINQSEPVVEEQEDIVDDQPVTTDLTLTKTVELTENEPDIEEKVIEEEKSEQKTFNNQEVVENRPIEIVKPMMMIEEPREIEVSQYNFESTMDDISDAELESLEQELEEIVAAEQNFTNENAVKELEKIVEENSKNEESKDEVKVEEQKNEVIEETKNEEEKAVEEISNPKLNDEKETEEVIEKMEITESEKSVEPINIAQVDEEEKDDPPSVQEESVSEAQEAIEPPTDAAIDPASSSTDESASIRNIPSQSNEDFSMNESNSTGSLTSAPDLGRVPPYWIPDNMTPFCMICESKFSTFKRRHHCRACGLLLCSSCCNEKFHLPYLNGEGRICKPCLEQLIKLQEQQPNRPRRPNPANPMEYCSTVPPSQQVNPNGNEPLTVMVPVPTSVLKRGPRNSERKSVIFSDGIRPGSDFEPTPNSPRLSPDKSFKVNTPKIIEKTQSFIPEKDNELPPLMMKENDYRSVDNNLQLLQRLRQEELRFAINKNFIINVKIVTRESIIELI